jgi:Ca2+-binding RTX toxin-like protein
MDGGDGDDTYYVDNAGDVAEEQFTGGHDQVYSSVSHTLGFGIEDLDLGVGSDDIDGTGNNLANFLFGNAGSNLLRGGTGRDDLDGWLGNDVLKGGADKDSLVGGQGQDKLAGGGGSDEFVFYDRSEGGDTITDFKNQSGNNDRFVIEASDFKGGLEVGRLSADAFQTSSDHAADKADTRFIFDTSDNTLWFDKNGSKAGGLTLIADLPASASIEADDIFII